MDFRYARPPPPPPSSDPHQRPPQQPVHPPPGPWYSGQFQYHSPSPPPPQWPPQHSDHHLPPHPPPYAVGPPPPMPYSSNPYPLPPRPHMPPFPPQPHYPPVNQEWSNANWGHQGWDYSAHNKNEDDWAARAKAWAASKAVTDDQHQHQHSQPVPSSRPEDYNYQDQYTQNPDPSYTEFQQHSHPPSSYQQYPSSFAPPPRTPANNMHEPSSFSSGYASDGNFSYTARDGNLRDSAPAYPHQETAPTAHQQEVPSSYSSVTGKEDMNGNFYQPTQVQPPVEQPHYASAEPATDLSNQPLDFVPRFSHDHDPFGQPKSGGPISTPTPNAWTSSAPSGLPYPVHPPGQQADPLMGVPSPVSMHSVPPFGRMGGSSFQPSMPPANPTFPIGTSNALYGTPGFSERHKKPSVPNWLREEIIKKAVIGTSAPDLSRQDTGSNEDEVIDPKGDQVDGKSMSTEEEDDDEDYAEEARNAAINQEIKRILTEVLLKVTDELFDDIATKVMNEDDLSVEVEHKASMPAAVSTPKTSAKVIIPAQTKNADVDDTSGKLSSSSPGDVLGLGNYASDDDDDDDEEEEKEVEDLSSKPSVQPVENGVSPNGEVETKSSSHTDHVTEEYNKSDEKIPDVGEKDEPLIEVLSAKNSLPDDSGGNGPDKNDDKRSGSKDEPLMEVVSGKNSLAVGNGDKRRSGSKDEENGIGDEKHIKRAKKDDNSKDEENGIGDEKHIKRAKKDDNSKERESGKRVSKDDRDSRRSHGKEDGRRSRRYNSPSPGGRGRSSHGYASSDSHSDDSRRKVHSKRRNLSPSPVRSRRSPPPPPPHSKRRHSIYSSLETTSRGQRKRSRSRSRR